MIQLFSWFQKKPGPRLWDGQPFSGSGPGQSVQIVGAVKYRWSTESVSFLRDSEAAEGNDSRDSRDDAEVEGLRSLGLVVESLVSGNGHFFGLVAEQGQLGKDEALAAIKHASGFIRREMCKYINLRVAPELHFVLDNTLEEASKLYQLIDKTVGEDEKKREAREKEE